MNGRTVVDVPENEYLWVDFTYLEKYLLADPLTLN